MAYLDWKVGDKVVFQGVGVAYMLGTTGWRKYVPGLNKTRLSHNLVAGEVYEIEALTTHTDYESQAPIVVVFLKGFRFREHKGIGFPAQWFRKVQTRKTSIEVFERILRDVTAKEDA